MSSSMTAIAFDIAEYKRLCDIYREQIQYVIDYYGNQVPDCYGAHANGLIERHKKEGYSIYKGSF